MHRSRAESFRSAAIVTAAGASLVLGVPIFSEAGLRAGIHAPALPPVPEPAENPLTEPKRVLGKILFWDEQLSSDNTTACASCHTPFRGGTDNRRVRHPGPDGVFNTADDTFGSPGVIRTDAGGSYLRDQLFGLQRQVTPRAANSTILAAYAPELFWDGRASGTFVNPQTGQVSIASGGALESQAVGPLLNDVEMAHPGRDWGQIAAKLRRARPLALGEDLTPDVAAAIQSHRTYPALFAAAFGDGHITAERIAFAIASYQRTLIADDTPWDRFIAGEQNALTPQQVQGFQAFQASNCAVCHTPPLFTDQTFRNIGLRPPPEDRGRQLVTNNPGDRGRFKVPSLRNTGLHTTFMHNGQFTNLTDVIRFYARAPGAPQQFPDNRDPIMLQVNVPPQAAIVIEDFLRNALTDARVANRQFPFDHPTLYGTRPAAQPVIVAPGTLGADGFVPQMIFVVPPLIGDPTFKFGVDRARAGATAVVAISTLPPVNGRVRRDYVVGPFTLGGGPAGTGYATLHWPIPDNPALDGRDMFVQWIISDDAAQGGEALSQAVRFRLFCGSAGCSPCPADWNGDGAVNSGDISAYITSWLSDVSSGGFRADASGDALVNSSDISAFISTWLAGVTGGC